MKGKLLIITSEFGKQGGGLSNSATQLANHLCDLGFRVEVVISSQSHINDNLKHSNLKVIHDTIRVASGGYNPNLQRDLFFRGHLNNVSKQQQNDLPDLVIAFGCGLNGLFASELSKLLNVKLVAMPRGSELNLAISNADLFHFNQKCFQQAAALVCVSNELLQSAKNIFYNPQVICKIIPNIINIDKNLFELNKKENGSEIVIGTGAKYLNEKKGIANLLQAMALLNQNEKHKFSLRLAGFVDDDLLAKYNEIIQSFNLNGHVMFLGVLNRNQFLDEIKNWNIALQGSFCEGFSNSIGDAISIGKPFMVTDTGFVAEQIRNDFPELIFFNSAPESIAEKISETFYKKDIVKLSSLAANSIKQIVSSEAVILQWKALIDGLLSLQKNTTLRLKNEHIITLMLHDISEMIYTGVDLPISKLEELCKIVSDNGFKFCSAEHYFSSLDKSKLIICTFDDGYKNVLKFGLPILSRFEFTATVFVCTNHIGQTNEWNTKDKTNRQHMTIEELHLLKKQGWEIGSHGTNHISFNRLSEGEILSIVSESKKTLSSEFGSINSFAYPYGDTSPFIEGLVKQQFENVFTTDSGGTHILLDRHRIRRYSLTEIQTLFSR
ncbi:MAG: glycosyltransferase [Chitinophagales bacterium]|jgi:glycosyltransferase involved in cell wall biosynthesis